MRNLSLTAFRWTLLSSMTLVVSPDARGQHPTVSARSVLEAFPAADSYRVITRDIGAVDRVAIQKRLPFRLHYDSLGVHTLYVATRKRRPIGLLYVQYERTDSGLATVQWRVGLDQRIIGLQFQRARSPFRKHLEGSTFVKSLLGADVRTVGELLDRDGSLRDPSRVPAQARSLAAAIARSASKCLTVLDVVWPREIQQLEDAHIGLGAFTEGWVCRRMKETPPAGASCIARRIIEVLDERNLRIGSVVDLNIYANANHPSLPVRLVIDCNRVVKRVQAPDTTPAQLRERLKRATGKSLRALAKDDEGPLAAYCAGLSKCLKAKAGR